MFVPIIVWDMELKSTQYMEKTGSVAETFLFLFYLLLSNVYNLFKFECLENEEARVSVLIHSRTSGEISRRERGYLSANNEFLVDRAVCRLG